MTTELRIADLDEHTLYDSKTVLGAKKGWKEKNTALSLLQYEVLKPSDFLRGDITNYIVVTVAKGMMSLWKRVVSHVFIYHCREETFSQNNCCKCV